ncbi:DNA (cytosine-5-)-methyltransferase [Proteus vulgaris]|uniref:DNA (cytosine-5-)-methyltransferase n=1 Tax=Proteus vulgaris TaxID=585 RepID=A0A6G6SKZ1_PROVU|nr:DNA (cytosine-5-)-methyltransferase [Proteus vulgaris]QIF93944.1 DNA (cytosine-5-)-methyltransferase [Proteus vulgaris]QIF94461.1 DNA (cytosine-5-)-methyltransferase [Proteus vulgaris]QIF95206.1 DNA (cytosine-5-)-methyltransferase [Proteus vulgaris]
MIYLSLFNGISAGRLALSRAGIKFDKYYIAEIDKFANKVSEFHYPDNIQLGDVNNWREWDIDWSSVGLVTAGFPCQSWSLAGKQLGDKDERGKLFWTTLEIMGHVLENNPDAKFMLENVKMKREFEEYITLHTERALGYVNKTLINSSLLSAQNRQRYYWANFEISQPADKGILLKDIIDDDSITDREKSYCIDANYSKGTNLNQYLNKSRRQIVFRPCEPRENIKQSKDGLIHVANASDIRGNEQIKRIYSDAGKAPTLSTCQGGHREPKVSTGNLQYRKLTPTECARLQTFPDGWCENIVSNSQSYKCYGNAWTVDVIAHIFKCAYRESKHEAIRPTVNYEQSCSANI